MLVVALGVGYGVDGVQVALVSIGLLQEAGKGVAGGMLQGKGNNCRALVTQSNARATRGLARAIAR